MKTVWLLFAKCNNEQSGGTEKEPVQIHHLPAVDLNRAERHLIRDLFSDGRIEQFTMIRLLIHYVDTLQRLKPEGVPLLEHIGDVISGLSPSEYAALMFDIRNEKDCH